MSNIDINIMLECKTCGNDIEKCTCGETNIIIGKLCILTWLGMVAGCVPIVYTFMGTSL